MSKQSLSIADELFYGRAAYGRANQGRRGVRVTLQNVHSFAPAANVVNGVCVSQSVGAGANAVLNGSLVVGGVAVFDVPRAITLAWTTASTITIHGTDAYGEPVTQTVTTAAGVTTTKAFKTITRISSSASITVLIVGTSKVFGLPVKVTASNVLAARFNNAIDAGTFVPADATAASATTGDVRGTFTPAGTPDATAVLSLLLYCHNPVNKVNAYGLANFFSGP